MKYVFACYLYMSIGKVYIYIVYWFFCFFCCNFCTVTDLSGENKASGVKFCTVVHGRPGQGISHFGELCSPRSPKSDESAGGGKYDRRRSHPLTASAILALGMCEHTAVAEDRRRPASSF